MGRLLTFGEVMGRFEPEPPYRFSQKVPGSLLCTFAGAEANVAASFALLGGAASYASALPSGPLPDAFIRQMRGLGVDTSRVLRTQTGRMGLLFLETGSCQRSGTVWYDRDYSSIALCGPDAYDWNAMLEGVDYLHISGITPAVSEQAALSSIALVREAAKRGIRVSVDLNFRKKLWKWNPAKSSKELAGEVIGEMLKHTDLVIGNEEDAQDVLGIKAGNSNVTAGKLDIERYPDVASRIAALYPSVSKIAFTLRESVSASHNNWGAMLWTRPQGAVFAPLADGKYEPYRITDIVDRVGGGDSFAAGLLFALQDDEFSNDPQKCLSFAVAASCLCHTIRGDFNYVSRDEVVSLMNGDASGRVKR